MCITCYCNYSNFWYSYGSIVSCNAMADFQRDLNYIPMWAQHVRLLLPGKLNNLLCFAVVSFSHLLIRSLIPFSFRGRVAIDLQSFCRNGRMNQSTITHYSTRKELDHPWPLWLEEESSSPAGPLQRFLNQMFRMSTVRKDMKEWEASQR